VCGNKEPQKLVLIFAKKRQLTPFGFMDQESGFKIWNTKSKAFIERYLRGIIFYPNVLGVKMSDDFIGTSCNKAVIFQYNNG